MLEEEKELLDSKSACLSTLQSFLKRYPFSTKEGTRYELHEGYPYTLYIQIDIGETWDCVWINGGYEIKSGRHQVTEGSFSWDQWEDGYVGLLRLLKFLKLLINQYG